MARQEFKQGEVVMLHSYGDTWKSAVIVRPDIPQTQFAWNSPTPTSVHNVEVWTGNLRTLQKNMVAPLFRTYTLRNNRRDILGLDEYERTVGVRISEKRQAREAHDQKDRDNLKIGLEFAVADVLAGIQNHNLRDILTRWIPDYILQREGRPDKKEGN